ncbi:MAG: hypothetical protein ABI181_14115 [Mycobacteriaceae bacterium]
MTRTPVRVALAATAAAAALLLSACSASSTTASSPAPAGTSAPAGAEVVPVKSNPISNTATVPSLAIGKIQVENNTDAGGKAVSDHLQLDLRNTGTTVLGGFEVFYTFADPAAGKKESYYLKLPASFTIPAGATKPVNFDNAGGPGHFPVNKFSLFNTSKAALDVTVEVSAAGAAPVTATAKKGPGGSENIGG